MSITKSNLPTIYRVDHDEIVKLVPDGASVLDLGCGDGTLLLRLINEKHVKGQGVEIDQTAVLECLSKGLSVYHGNLDDGLEIYEDQSFDYVILNQTLQVLHHPRLVLREMLRVGRHAIVSFPNFAHWRLRSYLFFKGMMPKNDALPFEWFDTPNIHLCTIKDFELLCRVEHLQVESSRFLRSFLAPLLPNVFALTGIFVVEKKSE